MALRPNAGHGLLILEISRSHTKTHHSRYDSSGRVISSSQRPLPDNTQHSQQTNIYAPGGIRTQDLSKRAAADIRLRPRGHWDRHIYINQGTGLDRLLEVQEFEAPKYSRQSAREGCKVVSPTYLPPLSQVDIPATHFC